MPDAALVGRDGRVKPEFVWAALDCPGGWAVAEFQQEPKIVLGQLAVEVFRPLPGGEQYVVVGWPVAKEAQMLGGGRPSSRRVVYCTPSARRPGSRLLDQVIE
jgi:hypothetical protein